HAGMRLAELCDNGILEGGPFGSVDSSGRLLYKVAGHLRYGVFVTVSENPMAPNTSDFPWSDHYQLTREAHSRQPARANPDVKHWSGGRPLGVRQGLEIVGHPEDAPFIEHRLCASALATRRDGHLLVAGGDCQAAPELPKDEEYLGDYGEHLGDALLAQRF